MYKVVNGISLEAIHILRSNTHFNLGYTPTLRTEPVHSVFNGSESASYLGFKIWEQIPNDVKIKNSLVRFKKETRKWKPENYPLRTCKVFIPNLGSVKLNIST